MMCCDCTQSEPVMEKTVSVPLQRLTMVFCCTEKNDLTQADLDVDILLSHCDCEKFMETVRKIAARPYPN